MYIAVDSSSKEDLGVPVYCIPVLLMGVTGYPSKGYSGDSCLGHHTPGSPPCSVSISPSGVYYPLWPWLLSSDPAPLCPAREAELPQRCKMSSGV